MARLRTARMLAFLTGAALALPTGAYLAGGAELRDMEVSPDRQQRVEFHSLARWKQIVRLSYANDDNVAVLTDANDGRVLGTGEVFYANGTGPVRWSPTKVDVGMAGSFDRRTGAWAQGEGSD